MSRRWLSLCGLIAIGVLWQESGARAQALPGGPPPSKPREQEWNVVGRVTSLKGRPVAGATVQLDIGGGPGGVKTVETNLQGGFEANISPGASSSHERSIKVAATQENYFDAWETVRLESPGETTRLELVMRDSPEDVRQLLLAKLISSVASRLRTPPGTGSAQGRQSEMGAQEAGELLERGDAESAIPILRKLVQSEPSCVSCRALLGLALLGRGSWVGATRELTQAAALDASEKGKARSPEPFLILGVLETWRGHLKRAGVFLLQALEVEPSYPLALQELGRVFVLAQRTAVADQYLKKAIQAGASADAHFLRARALLDKGVPGEAEAEMQAYLDGRRPKDLPRPIRMEWLQMTNRLQIESKGKVSSVVDIPLTELLQELPPLRGLQPARSQDELAPILRKVGEGVRAFFTNFPNTSSEEEIILERLGGDGKVRESMQRNFRYLLLSEVDPSGFGLKEHRTGGRGVAIGPTGVGNQLMVTEGFASQSLHFHPDYQDGSRFRYLGRQSESGHATYVVAFAQRPETARVLEDFRLKDNNTVVLVQGVAWVDAGNYQILRMRTDLLKPATEIRLERQTTDISFREVEFASGGSKLWLPREVSVTVAWNGKILRNLHRYSDFQLFTVEARERFKAPRIPEAVAGPQ